MGSETLLNENAIESPAVKAWKEKGGKVIGTICCHVPEEMIDAAGMLPVRLRGTGCTDDSEAEAWMSPFSCSFVRAQFEYLLNGTYDFLNGIATSDGCLLAGRIHDNWKYAGKEKIEKEGFMLAMMSTPRIIDNRHTMGYYKEELEALKAELERVSGEGITDEKLKASVEKYNETRALIREMYELRKAPRPVISGTEALLITLSAMSMEKGEFNKKMRAFIGEAKNRKPPTAPRARLMIIGSAIDDPAFLKIIEDKGGLIVTDVQCFGSRYLWEPVTLDGSDVMGSLAKSYLERPVCPRVLDIHDELYKLYMDMIRDYAVDGVIYVRMKYCEIWGGESLLFESRFKEAGIPLLTLEREEIMTNEGQLAVRVEAFIEMIEKEDK
jgi:bzd-type benzoyl-CoA reductase N subunit